MNIDLKIKHTKKAIEKTKSPYAKRDLEKYLKRLYMNQQKSKR